LTDKGDAFMKKTILFLMLIFMAAGGLLSAGDVYYTSPFRWYSPEVLAQGGSFMANAKGFNALLTNPAAFAKSQEKDNKDGTTRSAGELTILSIGGSYAGNIFQFMEDFREDTENFISTLLDQVTDTGLGAGMEIGTGYVGRGVGIGLLSVVDADLPLAESTLGVTVDLTSTTGLVAGYAHPFDLGPVKLVAGADIRPMYRILIPNIDIAAITGSDSDEDDEEDGDLDFANVDAFSGIGVGVDAGADLFWREFTFSLVMRDIGNTRFFFKPLHSLGTMTFSDADEVEDRYITPWSINLGVAYHPVFGKINKLLDFTVHTSYSQPLIFEDKIYGYEAQSFWTKLDMGAEVVLLSSVALRAGFQGGYFTTGFGLDLFIMELSGALYAEEVGSNAGVQPKLGGALEFAFRF
jgi:hypothetical protein